MAAMRKEYFSHTWNLFELTITLVGIIDVILTETNYITYTFEFIQTVIFFKIVRFLRILRILKVKNYKIIHFQILMTAS